MVQVVTETHCARLYVGAEPDVAEAMRQTRRMAEALGFAAVQVSYIATVATELASNLFIHGGGGTFEAVELELGAGIELRVADHGPGIADLGLAMRDGYSTVGGLGCGLPGAKRLMDEFEIETAPGRGTRITARKWR